MSHLSSLSLDLQEYLVLHQQVRLHVVSRGPIIKDRPTLFFLHGWPQSWACWQRVWPLLASDLNVVAADMRGFGDSDKPHQGYDVATLADDQFAILDALGIERATVVAHDLGGPVAYAMAAKRPQRLAQLALFEAPLYGIEPALGAAPENSYWHMAFHQAPDLPELLIQGKEQAYLDWFFRHFAFRKEAFDERDLFRYVRNLQYPGALRGGLAHYRAIPESAAQIAEWAKVPLTLPVLAYGGEACLNQMVLLLAQRVAPGAQGGIVSCCGHWVPEERPPFVAEQVHRLLEGKA